MLMPPPRSPFGAWIFSSFCGGGVGGGLGQGQGQGQDQGQSPPRWFW